MVISVANRNGFSSGGSYFVFFDERLVGWGRFLVIDVM